MTDRKKPSAAFWATVVVVVALVAYPLSAGPVIWIESRIDLPEPIGNFIYMYCRPVLWVAWNGPGWVGDPVLWWLKLGEAPPPPPENLVPAGA
jgi:hypothetical protein